MKQGLSLRVSQHLALTPQLQQSIRLLQLSTLEMAQEVEQMLDENPFLERGEDDDGTGDAAQPEAPVASAECDVEEAAGEESGGEEADVGPDLAASLEDGWEGTATVESSTDETEWGGDAPSRGASDGDDEDGPTAVDLASAPIGLQEHLHAQARCLRLTPQEQAALYFLIESLNEDGYLDEPLDVLAEHFWRQMYPHEGEPALEAREEAEVLLRTALGWLHHMEPAGVGARDLRECLRLQILDMRNSPQAQAALKLCEQPLELLAKRDVRRLVNASGLDEASVRAGLALIARLEPKPGRRFTRAEHNVIVPDVIVTRSGRGFKVQLNPEVMPRLRVQEAYANALRQGRGGAREGAEGYAAMQQRLQEARWFIKNIQQRFDTILRVASAIVERQRNFFMHGELAMRPLVLREIADELGLHESTISRVTTAKYMATPFGTYELKYFFGSSLGTETGGNASSTAVRALLRQFIAAEEPTRPLSDNQLADLLREQGIECARRTVAKYREAMRIAPANLRKAL
jgi:RNA polymerase sigma-54 factor